MNDVERFVAMYAAYSVPPDEDPPSGTGAARVSLREAQGRDDADTWPCPDGCDCMICEPPGHFLPAEFFERRDGARVGNVLETSGGAASAADPERRTAR